MKKLFIILACMLMSCNYTIRDKNQIRRDAMSMQGYRDDLDALIQETEKVQDSVRQVAKQQKLLMIRYKDSINFMNLSKTPCYDKNAHRHSCQTYN